MKKNEIHVVNSICDEYSKTLCKKICSLIKEKYGCDVTGGKRVKKEALNIFIIHNAEYYNEINDPHDKEFSGVAVQHITLEDFPGNEEFALSSIVHEVLIKKDLTEGTMLYLLDFLYGGIGSPQS